MAGLKKESLIWLDQLEVLRARPHAGRPELQKALNVRNSHITNLVSVKACFDPAAIEKVRQAAQANPPHILSFKNAVALASLSKAKPDDLSPIGGLPGALHTALDMALSQRLTTLQIKALVQCIIDKKPLAEFDPKKVKALKRRRSAGNGRSESKDSPSVLSPAESETPKDEEEDNDMTWQEKYDHAKKTNALGWFYLSELLPFVILGGLGWLAWKVIVFVFTRLF